MGLVNPSQAAALEYAAPANISSPLAQQIESQAYEMPDEKQIDAVQWKMHKVKSHYLKEKLVEVKGSIKSCGPCYSERCFYLAHYFAN